MSRGRAALGVAVVFFVGIVAGCGSIPIASGRPTAASASATGEPAHASVVQMCVLMPLADVQAKSPFQTPLSQFKPGTEPGMCEYRSADDAADQVSILLELSEFGRAADAKASLANARQAAVDAGLPVADVSGLGDAAFSSGVDEVGVHAVSGKRVVNANLRGEWPDTTDDAKVAAGTELIRAIVARLP